MGVESRHKVTLAVPANGDGKFKKGTKEKGEERPKAKDSPGTKAKHLTGSGAVASHTIGQEIFTPLRSQIHTGSGLCVAQAGYRRHLHFNVSRGHGPRTRPDEHMVEGLGSAGCW